MNRSRSLTFLVVILCLLAAGGFGPTPAQASPPASKVAPWVIEHTTNGAQAEFLVVLTDQADLRGAQRLSTKLEKGRYVRDALWNKAQSTQAPLLKWLAARGVEYRSFYIVNLIWVKGDQNLALELAARPDVARIESNPQIRMVLPQDTVVAPFSTLSIESNITYVRAPDVWAMGYTGQGVVVGGQDTGYQWDHPALKSQYRGWNGTTADHNYNWHDSIHSGGGSCGANSPYPCDDTNHGTHTMGTVVGSDGGSNQIGMAPGAKWIGCRNMNQGAGQPSTYLECFEFFLAPYPVGGTPAQGDPSKAPDVTNNSWTCPPSEGCSWNTLQSAVEAQSAAGILTVVSAGNDGSSCSTVQDSPAIYAASYSVGALNKGTDTIASFSSRGPVTVDGSNRRKPDISAPGTSIRSSLPGGTYGSMSGTSMAGPHVAGAVALLWSAVPSLKHQIASTEQYLNDNAVHISSTACSSSGWPNNTYGYGRLDVKAAVDAAMGPTPTPTPTPPPGSEQIVNGGFENGTSPWVASAKNGHTIVSTSRPHTGSYSALLGGYNSANDTIYQTITIPSNGTLTYWWYMTTQDTGSRAYDYLRVRLYNTSGTLVATLRTWSNTSTKDTWSQDTLSLSSYAGQTLRVHFGVTTNSSKSTTFYVDDVSVK